MDGMCFCYLSFFYYSTIRADLPKRSHLSHANPPSWESKGYHPPNATLPLEIAGLINGLFIEHQNIPKKTFLKE